METQTKRCFTGDFSFEYDRTDTQMRRNFRELEYVLVDKRHELV